MFNKKNLTAQDIDTNENLKNWLFPTPCGFEPKKSIQFVLDEHKNEIETLKEKIRKLENAIWNDGIRNKALSDNLDKFVYKIMVDNVNHFFENPTTAKKFYKEQIKKNKCVKINKKMLSVLK